MEDQMTNDELIALWQVAWEIARRLCGRTLSRLASGDGGFYGAEDFQQDLFLEFWALTRVWRRHNASPEALWRAWRRRLWGGGRRILRRAPQRLWHSTERTFDPSIMALGDFSDEEANSIPFAVEALSQPEDAEATQTQKADLQALEEALWALRPAQRQIVYMAAMLEISPSEVARILRLGNAREVYQRLYRARRALRQRLAVEAK